MPEKNVEAKLLKPILSSWEKSPSIMEGFLRYLSLLGSAPELGDRLIELWFLIGDKVLSSSYINSSKPFIRNDINNILGLLIFSDPKRFAEWKVQEWAPLRKTTTFIDRWCDNVGHHWRCFPSLINLLRTIGFNLIPEYGINWLHSCLMKVDDHIDFFKKNEYSRSLAELLNDAWFKYGNDLRDNPAMMRKFADIIDILAKTGERIAIRLQEKIVENEKKGY